MLVEIRSVENVDRLNRKFKHDVFVLKCDVCGTEYECRGSASRILSRKTHTCSRACKRNAHKSGGAIAQQRAATCLARYGTENAFAAEPCKTKMRETWLEKYGVEHARSSEHVKSKVRQTMIERYGERPIASPTIQRRIRESMQRNWGVDYPMQLVHVREAMINGSIAKWGVPYHMMNPEHAADVIKKRAEEGTLYQSKPENALYEALCDRFGRHDVQRQVVVNKFWSIDFHIVSIDTYVQFDGVYWHGLNRPIEVIKESGRAGHKRDMAIYRKWVVDRQQVEWFAAHDMRLIRVTDVEFKSDPDACLLKIVER